MNKIVPLLLLIILAACEKDPVPLTTDSSIRGYIGADSAGRQLYGIKVTAVGPYGEVSVVTSTSEYLITNLGNGTYYLIYSKKGFGTQVHYGIQLFGSDRVYVPQKSLILLPSVTTIPKFIKAYVTEATSPPSASKYINVEMAVTSTTLSKISVMLFMSTKKDVAWNNYEFMVASNYVRSSNYIPYIRFTCSPPFTKGQEVFVRGYPYSMNEYYYGVNDFYHGQPSMSTLLRQNPTNVVSFIMP